MPDSSSIAEAAARFDVHEETVRRWIRAGCPCVSPGEVGRGHGARLDLNDVARWRAARAGMKQTGDVMTKVETALLDVLRRDGGNGYPLPFELGLSQEQAARLLADAHARIARALQTPPECSR